MQLEALKAKAAQYRAESQTALANHHRLLGAAIALEEVAAEMAKEQVAPDGALIGA